MDTCMSFLKIEEYEDYRKKMRHTKNERIK